MSYLEQYDSVPADQPQQKVSLASRWLREEWQPFFKELREHRPIFPTPAFTLVTRFKDVQEILSRNEVFSVRLYAPKMDPVAGPIMLARDNTPYNWREKSIMKAMLQPEELPAVRRMVGRLADEALDRHAAGGRIELVNQLARLVPVQLCGEYFGFPGPDVQTMFRWSKTAQTNMFKNLGNNPDIQAASVQSGKEMTVYLEDLLSKKRPPRSNGVSGQGQQPEEPETFLARLRRLLEELFRGKRADLPRPSPAPVSHNQENDVFARLLRTHFPAEVPFDDQRIIANMMALLIGTVETTSQAIVQSVEQILLRPDVFKNALQAARDDDDQLFDAYVWEALRFNPINPLLFRYCESDYTLAAGTDREQRIPARTTVFACTASAMFDATEIPDADTFRTDRPPYHTMHFGYGDHICLGKYVGMVMIPEAVKRVLLRPGVQLLPGDEGKINFQGGPFPEQFNIRLGGGS
ncbi:MAG TPA: cytochrome P450 [Pyrinomonadaceae bacterium]|nr:cytochrome P450 [Pyrinomonadaceae bacterium]